MSGRILIIETISINRIALQTMLQAAHYDVTLCDSVAEAAPIVDKLNPDLIIADTATDAAAARLFIAGCLTMPRVSAPPVIALVPPNKPAARLAALRAGAVDVIDKPAPDALLKARIRSLLRSRAKQSELQPAAQNTAPDCFAEPAASFDHGANIAILSPQADRLPLALTHLTHSGSARFNHHSSVADFVANHRFTPPDLILIDATLANEAQDIDAPFAPSEVFRMLADLRSRAEYRHCAQLVMLPEGAVDLATLSLDLGADDIVTKHISRAELEHRIKRLIAEKMRADQMRTLIKIELQAAMTDSLTGLHNRRFALPEIKSMADDAARSGGEFAVMVLDIDLFKGVNDRWGHAAGDQVLINVAKRLRDALRPGDLLARIGGEEFLVAMSDTTLDNAQTMAERLRSTVERSQVICADGKEICVTLSVGVAMGNDAARTDQGIDALFRRADRALYEAKESGRNTVTLAHTAA